MAQFRILPYSVNSLLRLHLLLYFVFKIAIGNREVFKLRQFTLFMLALSGLLLSPGYANASFSSTLRDGYNTLTDTVAQTWNDKYNERPWGAGFGMSRWDEKGNWHGLYLMAFKDSFNKWEPIGGYGWEKTWRPLADDNFHLGLGYTLGVTARDNWNYIPIPVVLPLASIGYGPATFQMTYIPGTYNNGNVYFAWARIQF